MLKSIPRVIRAGMLMIATLGSSTFVAGQTPTGPAITGTGAFTSFVENMDRSLAFYHDAFDMLVPELPVSGQRPYNQANPQLFKFFDIEGAKERHQSARVNGRQLSIELMEIQEVPHRTMSLRIQDPGNATIVFIVHDVDAALARATQAKATVETPGGKPIMFADGTRSILIRDIDGRIIELRRPNPLPPSGGSGRLPSILDMRLAIAVNNMDETLKVYRNVLGFTVEGDTKFAADTGIRSLTGLAKAEVRRCRVQAPGSTLWIEFVEFKGVDRKRLQMRIQDRGAARLQLRANDTDAVVAAVKAAGLKVMSTGGVAQPIPPNFKGVLVADPNNFFLTPFAPCDGCAPGIGVPARSTK